MRVQVEPQQDAVHRAMMQSWDAWRETLENTPVFDSAVYRVLRPT